MFPLSDIPSDNEFYDVPPDMGSLISTYPSMVSPGGVALEDHLSDSDESFESASETFSYAVINYNTMARAVLNMIIYMYSAILLVHSIFIIQ